MGRKLLCLAAAALTLGCTAVLWSQEDPEGEPIRVGVTEVVVPVTVTDQNDKFVTGLKKADFDIYDQGVKQTIKYFSAERSQPVVVGFLMDLSSSMKIQWKEYKENAIEMALTLLPGDQKYQGYLIGYSTEAELMVNTTNEADRLVAKLEKVTPGGGAALYDGIYLACTSRKLVKGEPLEPHRVLIVMGDGHDNASHHTMEEVIELAQRNLMTIYAVSTDAYGMESGNAKNLRRLADATGGRVEYPLMNVYANTQGFLSRPANDGNREFGDGTGGYQAKILGSLFKSIQAIAGEITTQYMLRYSPNTPGYEGDEHSLHVEVHIPNVNVRSRTQYFTKK
jgi:VWFA-related protein